MHSPIFQSWSNFLTAVRNANYHPAFSGKHLLQPARFLSGFLSELDYAVSIYAAYKMTRDSFCVCVSVCRCQLVLFTYLSYFALWCSFYSPLTIRQKAKRTLLSVSHFCYSYETKNKNHLLLKIPKYTDLEQGGKKWIFFFRLNIIRFT